MNWRMYGLLAVSSMILPAILYWAGYKPWAWGWLIGEVLGAVSLLWISATVRKVLTKTGSKQRFYFLWQGWARYILIGLALYLTLRLSLAAFWGVLVGYFSVQLIGSVLQTRLPSAKRAIE